MSEDDIEKTAHYLTLDLIGGIYDNAKGYELEVAINALGMFTAYLVSQALKAKSSDKLTKAEKVEFTSSNYSAMKGNIQNAVSSAFTQAMLDFSGKKTDYYCQVRPIGPAINKEPI